MAGREKDCRWVWPVGSSMASESRGLSAGVVCRVKFGEWVKRIVGGVWSVGAKSLRGSRGLLAECGLSGRKCCVGQRNWRRSVVCRGEKGEWVKGIVGRVWSVGAKRASGSRELLAECGLSGQVCCVGQRNWRRRVVCRRKFVAWVKRIVGACGLSGQVWRVGQRNCRRVWSVGTSMASGSKELSAECGLSGRKGRVGQEACWRRVVCRDKFVAWVKGIVGGVWSVGAKTSSGSRELSTACGLSARKGRVGQRNWRRVWSVGVKTASESKKPHISYAPNVANRHSDQNCQNPQNMIHLL